MLWIYIAFVRIQILLDIAHSSASSPLWGFLWEDFLPSSRSGWVLRLPLSHENKAVLWNFTVNFRLMSDTHKPLCWCIAYDDVHLLPDEHECLTTFTHLGVVVPSRRILQSSYGCFSSTPKSLRLNLRSSNIKKCNVDHLTIIPLK